MNKIFQHLFGPVPSRRFGRSLGVDLTPFKTCSLDCVFCQLGRTTDRTTVRREYVPVAQVEQELAQWLEGGGKADYVTLAGSGEPTLHSRFGEVLRFVREHAGIPTALLSNGTLFTLPEVRAAALAAHVVKLSLSAWDPPSFERINRPHPDLQFERIVEGYRAFRKVYTGSLRIEVFLLRGINDDPVDVERIATLVNSLSADEIQLNTAVRPPAESTVQALRREEMDRLTPLFHPVATVIAEFPSDRSADVAANEETILAMLKRRPCTAKQVAEVFGMHLNEISKYIGKLSRTGRVVPRQREGGTYFAAADAPAETQNKDIQP
jgi:wyosine [tRNA(Phe)-imidazoG37] synthetase (radical SAM superfamily)